jgi:hypothetical protein
MIGWQVGGLMRFEIGASSSGLMLELKDGEGGIDKVNWKAIKRKQNNMNATTNKNSRHNGFILCVKTTI